MTRTVITSIVPCLLLAGALLVAQEAPKPQPVPAPAPAPSVNPPPAPATTTTNTGAQQPAAAVVPAPEDPAVVEARKELAKLSLERDRLTAENAIAKEKLTKELTVRRAELERNTLRLDEEKAKMARETETLRMTAERDLAKLKADSDRLTLEATLAKTKSELRLNELRLQEAEARTEIAKMAVAIEQKNKELEAANYACTSKPCYMENPHVDNKLIISDRRIPLNGPIVARTADEVADRLDYYNNRDPNLPIFIVIDSSPGGSVMSGYKILRAMEGSKAPVYVVVKQFAASMAACIATLADKSFAYPNARILHHQVSGAVFGNLTQHKENLAEIEQWWRRLAGPVAKKMGISLDDFIKRMYQEVSSGDWTEFADKAQQLKWVDVIVNEIQETGIMKHPDLSPTPVTPVRTVTIVPGGVSEVPLLCECLDEKGRPFMMLPRANPKDVYYLYNPDQYYRLP